jgi:hypothetical protein
MQQPASPESAEQAAQQTEEQAELERRYAEACPMHVGGTEVTAQTVPNGAALVFTTAENVDELRAQVDRFADAHNELAEHMSQEAHGGASMGSTMGSMYGMESGEGAATAQQSSFVPSRAEVEEVDGGAEIVLTPRDPSKLQALRQNVEAQARQMASGACPLMEPGSAKGGNELRIGG